MLGGPGGARFTGPKLGGGGGMAAPMLMGGGGMAGPDPMAGMVGGPGDIMGDLGRVEPAEPNAPGSDGRAGWLAPAAASMALALRSLSLPASMIPLKMPVRNVDMGTSISKNF